jgi:hypothetical protein
VVELGQHRSTRWAARRSSTPAGSRSAATVLPNLPAGDDKVVPELGRCACSAAPICSGGIVTGLAGRDRFVLNDLRVAARTIRIDSTHFCAQDFGISPAETDALRTKGYDAAEQYCRRGTRMRRSTACGESAARGGVPKVGRRLECG